ncbi:flagellar basal body L-ring protein FlgH [Stappia taiwanensis]|uniref:Flagellar L-ring protein n=1 Tax=Stappia taiwanensis TaxID=992267 RepID=A0A838XTX8_9HYPH|nr:flagellar basal body L-ring protein FlgH [Stappia taiwanensis]MBA4610453.1 flagellar basal body L-ring protein FlgH [Stappia taiwanensis]GGE84822.1 flagellar L-ring protein 1 [Stappia taiwanensis]
MNGSARYTKPLLAVTLALVTAGCGAADRLSQVGKAPALSAIQDPTTTPGYRPVQMPMPTPQSVHYNSNSLWRSGARAFFKDQRAARVGDILTVLVTISDKAEFDNETERNRVGSDSSGTGGAVGAAINTLFLPAGTASENLVTSSGTSTFKGKGKVDREEKLKTKVAAVVTQSLPNGNLVIEGRQEIRVNFEVRELIVAGVVRPEDISANNTIESAKIAEARIGYGGRGQITDVQQPRYGSQVLDIVLPF